MNKTAFLNMRQTKAGTICSTKQTPKTANNTYYIYIAPCSTEKSDKGQILAFYALFGCNANTI